MNNKPSLSTLDPATALDLKAAVEDFVAQGGVIAVIADGTSSSRPAPTPEPQQKNREPELDQQAKLELLKGLVDKGAGVSSLQYSLRMNKKEIRQLALAHGIKISFSRPVTEGRYTARHEALDVDDVLAGHAMHYSTLGYTVPEIAQVLGLSIRQVWNIGKAYRFEFKQYKPDDSLCGPEPDTLTPACSAAPHEQDNDLS
ncbi:helix-turn-helix domain-containing protein [Pseudomonas sp. Leaf127]|uniref:helix-turn-helix domain-containing protein n=1 Tax=Pseudomonas sp. Leaf127 TaxID=1736267 RepID=UPI0009E977F4|nr:helix-turn-helix domain-containing protein [Pseudomonas sp. Leaf127]